MTICNDTNRDRLYPAITACMGEDRPPSRAELRFVAARLWREVFVWMHERRSAPASFALRRTLLRATRAALSGSTGPTRSLSPTAGRGRN